MLAPGPKVGGRSDSTVSLLYGRMKLKRTRPMGHNAARRFPFAALGLVLLAVSVAPTVIGMVRGFDQLGRDDDAAAISSGVALAFHPAFMAC